MTEQSLTNGDLVVAGRIFGGGAIRLGSSTPIFGSDGAEFVARLRGDNGEPIWIQQFAGTQNLVVNFLDKDSQDDLYIAGTFSNTISLNGTTYTGAGSADVFIAKLSGASGNVTWSHAFGGPSLDFPAGLSVDAMGDVALAGYYAGSIAIGNTQAVLQGTNATFVVRYDGLTGAVVWAHSINSTDTDTGVIPETLATDASGNVIVGGRFLGTVSFGGGPVTASANQSNFLVKYSSVGNYVFERDPGVGATLVSMTCDSSGNIYLLAAFAGSVLINQTPLVSAGADDVLVARYSPAGDAQWSKAFGNSSRDQAHRIVIDGSGHLIISTTFQGTVSYGGASYVAAGSSDDLISRIRTEDGGYLGSIQVGGTGTEHSSAVGQKDGNIFIAGDFSGAFTVGGTTLAAPSPSGDGFAMLVVSVNL